MEMQAVTSPDEILENRRNQFVTQQSTVWSRRQQAVCVRRAFKYYGTKKRPQVVLDGLNMTVPRGVIYGLLGASGCGKTTLLSCIVGRRRLNSGEIWVLGGKPGSKGSGVPGPRIGYMPQEIALYGEFSIRETFMYFGWLNGMKKKDILDKLTFYLDLLQLPMTSRHVKNLSGGQQRRVSLAISMIHDPELLILDEPTVGVDPVLRESIWKHLVTLTSTRKTTIMITTHYIEETRQAHMIGLMRGGKFLAEESPNSLLQSHNCDTLEDVFLKLSKIQNQGKRRRSSYMQEVMGPPGPAEVEATSEISGEYGDNISLSSKDVNPVDSYHSDMPPEEETGWDVVDYLKVVSPNRMNALIWKNFLWLWRNVGIFAFITLLPIVETILYCTTIGKDPKGLRLAYVNDELNFTDPCPSIEGCEYSLLSCQYLASLKEQNVVLERFEYEDKALEQVRRGKAWGALHFENDYSEALKHRIEEGRYATEYVIDHSSVIVHLDMSNQYIGYMLQRNLLYAYLNFTKKLTQACDYNPKLATFPIRINDPIYGPTDPDFTNFAAPGIILTIIFFLAVALTTGALLMERKDGMLERGLVVGVTPTELLFSHALTQIVVMIIQTAMVLIFSFVVFDIVVVGPIGWVITLTFLNGMSGMFFGFVLASFCDEERTATYLALGSFLPIITICGICWPVEGMHYILKYISIVLPLTFPTESLRAMMARGWSMDRQPVYSGLISTGVWIFVFLIISLLVLKFKKG